jgi:hypothetical protein
MANLLMFTLYRNHHILNSLMWQYPTHSNNINSKDINNNKFNGLLRRNDSYSMISNTINTDKSITPNSNSFKLQALIRENVEDDILDISTLSSPKGILL